MEEAAPITEYDRSDKVAEVKSFLDSVEEAKRCKKTDIETPSGSSTFSLA
jgi:hypothetical protein